MIIVCLLQGVWAVRRAFGYMINLHNSVTIFTYICVLDLSPHLIWVCAYEFMCACVGAGVGVCASVLQLRNVTLC
jgi:hypothetical protein